MDHAPLKISRDLLDEEVGKTTSEGLASRALHTQTQSHRMPVGTEGNAVNLWSNEGWRFSPGGGGFTDGEEAEGSNNVS